MGVLIDLPAGLLQKAGVKDEKNAKLIVYGAITIVGIIGVIIVVRQVKKFFGKVTEKVDKHDILGSTTITKDDAKSLADRIWNLMNGTFFISCNALLQLFDGYNLTKGDKTMIYNAFGIRNNGFPFYVKGDLYFWLDRKVKFGIAECKEYFGI